MLTLLSPSKSLNLSSAPEGLTRSEPVFQKETATIAKVTARLKPHDLKRLMAISDSLAELNVARFRSFEPGGDLRLGKQAVLTFDGDVYKGLDAGSLTPTDLEAAQNHLWILSGFYGLLRPMDAIQPYRLEMGVPLRIKTSDTLYGFWRRPIAGHLSELLRDREHPTIVNLASQEYFSAVNVAALKGARIIHPVFQETEGDQAKIISFFAKKARGLMARFIIEHRVTRPDDLKDFSLTGYRFDPTRSRSDHWVFTRPRPAAAARAKAA